jgi:hypothetical protein
MYITKQLTVKCKRALLALLKPALAEWTHFKGYNLPLEDWLMQYEFEFQDTDSYPSVYNGAVIRAVGTHSGGTSTITVACKRTKLDVLETLVHELAHAIQYYNFGEQFHEDYRLEASKHAHRQNKWENEARNAETFLARFVTEKAIKLFCYSFDMEGYQHKWNRHCAYVDWSNDPNLKIHRKAWWLRR